MRRQISSSARPIEPHNINRAFARNAEVPVIRVHDTRASLDVHPRGAMQILSHSQISVTMNVYTQIPSPETRKALDRLARNHEFG